MGGNLLGKNAMAMGDFGGMFRAESAWRVRVAGDLPDGSPGYARDAEPRREWSFNLATSFLGAREFSRKPGPASTIGHYSRP